jgi:adenosylcobyric acid synthase
VTAYEIHMGLTEPHGEGQPAFTIESRNGQPVQVADGWITPGGRIWGSYLHGLFDNDEFRRALLQELRPVATASAYSFKSFQEAQFDHLAEIMRAHLDIARIRALIQP